MPRKLKGTAAGGEGDFRKNERKGEEFRFPYIVGRGLAPAEKVFIDQMIWKNDLRRDGAKIAVVGLMVRSI